MSEDEKLLFKRAPAADKLRKAAKKLARAQARKDWWNSRPALKGKP